MKHRSNYNIPTYNSYSIRKLGFSHLRSVYLHSIYVTWKFYNNSFNALIAASSIFF